MKKNILKFLSFIIAIMVITCMSVFAEDEPQKGGTLRVALNDLVHLDPNSVAADTEVYSLVYETLFELDENWQPTGVLVKDYEISDDGLIHTWHLQEGVTFSDGTPFNAEVVKWNLERKISLNLPFSENIPIDKIEAIDETTVKMTLKTHYLPLYYYLSSQSFSMYNPAFVEANDLETLKSEVSGTGPFVIDEYRPNDYVKMSPRPNYWNEENRYLDGVEFFIVSDANTRLFMLESGEVDLIKDLSLYDIDYLNNLGDENIVTEVEPSSRSYQVTMHNQRPPLDNKEVRQAFNYAIDKDGMNQSIFDGLFELERDLNTVSKYVGGYYPMEPYTYNPEKAKELLEANGLVDTNGDGYREWEGKEKEFILVTRKGQRPGDIEIAEQVQALLGEVGIKVRIDVMDSATYFTYLNQPMDTAPYYDLSNQSPSNYTGDKEYAAASFFLCDSWPGTLFNYSHYCNKEFDQLYEEAKKVTTIEERNKIYEKATEIAWDDAPSIFLFDGINTAGHTAKLHGIYSDGAHMNWQLKYAWFSE